MTERTLFVPAMLILFSATLFGQSPGRPSDLYDRTEAWIVARDGARLFTEIYSPNPQKYVKNIYKATESDFQKATQRVYRSRQFPSHIKVSVMK